MRLIRGLLEKNGRI